MYIVQAAKDERRSGRCGNMGLDQYCITKEDARLYVSKSMKSSPNTFPDFLRKWPE